MRAFATLVLSLATVTACGGPSAGPAAPGPGPVATGPAPAIRIDPSDGDYAVQFAATGLPAVSRDGANVVVLALDDVSPAIAPNLAVVVRDRADAEVHRIVVQTPAEGEAAADAGGKAPGADAKVAEANRYLAETHAQRGWFTLAPMTLAARGEGDDEVHGLARSASLDGVDLVWREGQVQVVVAGKIVVDRATAGWTAAPAAACDGCDACANPSYLGGAWIDPARKLIVATIAFVGTDACWEPPAVAHVVAWE